MVDGYRLMIEWVPLQHGGAVMGHSTETQLHTVQVVSCTTAAHTPSTTEYGHAKSCMPLSEDGVHRLVVKTLRIP